MPDYLICYNWQELSGVALRQVIGRYLDGIDPFWGARRSGLRSALPGVSHSLAAGSFVVPGARGVQLASLANHVGAWFCPTLHTWVHSWICASVMVAVQGGCCGPLCHWALWLCAASFSHVALSSYKINVHFRNNLKMPALPAVRTYLGSFMLPVTTATVAQTCHLMSTMVRSGLPDPASQSVSSSNSINKRSSPVTFSSWLQPNWTNQLFSPNPTTSLCPRLHLPLCP